MSKITTQPISTVPQTGRTQGMAPVSTAPIAPRNVFDIERNETVRQVSVAAKIKAALSIAPPDTASLANMPRALLRYELMKISEAIGMMGTGETGQACKRELNNHVMRLDRLQAVIEGQRRF